MEIMVYPDYDKLSIAAAQVVADIVKAKPKAVLGFATGSTPLGLYKELTRLHKAEGLDFSRVTTFNLDEYVGLKPDHEQSYRHFMFTNLFDHINVDPRNVHVPPGMADDFAAACEDYERMIDEAGGIDVQIVGIGSDGHIAFNEPASSLASRTRMKTLTKQTIDDNARFFEKAEDVPVFAITMGVGTVLEAEKLVFLANGANKAEAVADAIEGPVSAMCTASALQLHPDSLVFLDPAAAANLKFKDYYAWVQEKKPSAPS